MLDSLDYYLSGYYYWLRSGWAIGRVADFEAIGAGMDFALAALYLGHSVTEAVETAIELSVYCENPVQVLSWPILSS